MDSGPPTKRAKVATRCACACAGCSSASGGKRAPTRTDAQKLDAILAVIKAQNWTFACFLFNTFRTKDVMGGAVKRSLTHAQMVSSFLAGRGKRIVAHIVEQWLKDPAGRIPQNSDANKFMFSTTIPYTEIGPVRAALTTFSTQTVGKKLSQEAESAVKLTNGLHVSVGVRNPEKKVHWNVLGADTIPQVEAVIAKEQPTTVYLFYKIAMRKPRRRNGVILERKTRPARGVVTHAISALNFCRTDQANLLPLTRGILYFGSSAPIELMNYNARIRNMPSYSAVRRALVGLSAQEAANTEAHGKDPTTAGFMLIDNCQNQHKQRDLRIGRENVMNVGMSGLYMEAPDIDVAVFDLTDKRERIQRNKRKDVTVDQLLRFIDQHDADVTGALLFLETLTRCIPEMKTEHTEVHRRYKATATLVVPPGQAVVHPLASSGKKQTILTEFKDGMLDFLQQVGQTPDHYLKRKIPIGGDGLTYAILQQLQIYLQFDDDPFTSFEILEPQLHHPQTKLQTRTPLLALKTSRKSELPRGVGFGFGQ
ncbi:hypothetical protein B0H17DRAFT_941123 [Mycena rosella]|uniref:DUF6589 domain-containing protein n=1 Tax=Mycena rosella TaxID=1033263 RepID=A0AAD7D9B9_MYCRO|nr:hypothetical protein B0H17DRAFT_941123 [Mycena rosella]